MRYESYALSFRRAGLLVTSVLIRLIFFTLLAWIIFACHVFNYSLLLTIIRLTIYGVLNFILLNLGVTS